MTLFMANRIMRIESNKNYNGGKLLRIALFILLIGGFSSSSFADDEDDDLNLPDFSRTYGFDIRPDVRLNNHSTSSSKSGKKVSATSKKGFRSFKHKIKGKFTRTGKTGSKYGVQRYTKHTGSKRYGVGLKKRLGKNSKHGVVVHQRGANYEIESKNRKYYLGVDQRRPSQTFIKERQTYLFFGIKLRW